MRVLQAIAGAPHGGAELFFERLVPALSADGVTQHVLFRRDARRMSVLRDGGIEDLHGLPFGGPLDLTTRWAMRTHLRQFAPDILFTWMSRATAIAPKRPPSKRQYRHVARLGGYYDLKYYRHCDYLIGDTPSIVDYLTSHGWPADRAVYLPNFVVERPGQPIPRSNFFVPDGAPLLLGLGRLHANKGFDILLQSLVHLPDCYLLLAGVGPLEGELEALSVKLGVRPRVRFLGWRDDVTDLLATVDLFVHPARHEPLGNVILEAWAQACPVVCTAADGPAMLITSGESGLLTALEDVADLADGIRRAIADPTLRQSIATGGRIAYERSFTQTAVVAAYRAFFERILR